MQYLKNKFLNILSDLPHGIKVCLYGAGLGGKIFKRSLERNRADIKLVCFIDDFKKCETNGLQTINPEELPALKDKYDFILITSAYWVNMEKTLKWLDIEKYMVVNLSLFFDYQIFTEKEEVEYRHYLKQVEGLLWSDEDKMLYKHILKMRSYSQEEVPYYSDEYLTNTSASDTEYLDFINTENIKTVIEGGVLDGKNTLQFLKSFREDAFIYGFEPFFEAYLESEKRSLLEKSQRVKVYPLALWKNKETIRFQKNKDSSKIVTELEESEDSVCINAISIDEFVEENKIEKVDFIKLDIEGSELEALEGAVETLKNHRPQLAVCIYHNKKHLFEVPIFLDNVLEDYTYRIRHYSSSFWDTVWFAIPKDM